METGGLLPADSGAASDWGSRHLQESCGECGNRQPSLEGFDTIGGRRLTENGQLIDLSATLQGKKFSDGPGLGQYLHDNPKFPACVAKKLYAYAKGMDTEEVEASAFKPAYKAFADSGYRLRTLIKGLVESPEFFTSSPAVQEASTGQTKVASSP